MAKVYKITFLKPFANLKKGAISTSYSRDNAAYLISKGIAEMYKEPKAKKVKK